MPAGKEPGRYVDAESPGAARPPAGPRPACQGETRTTPAAGSPPPQGGSTAPRAGPRVTRGRVLLQRRRHAAELLLSGRAARRGRLHRRRPRAAPGSAWGPTGRRRAAAAAGHVLSAPGCDTPTDRLLPEGAGGEAHPRPVIGPRELVASPLAAALNQSPEARPGAAPRSVRAPAPRMRKCGRSARRPWREQALSRPRRSGRAGLWPRSSAAWRRARPRPPRLHPTLHRRGGTNDDLTRPERGLNGILERSGKRVYMGAY